MKPILFSTEMVKAILDSRKTMTRRVITKFYDIDCKKPKKCPIEFKNLPKDLEIQGFEKNYALFYSKSEDKYYCSDNLKYHIGDKLWVRETFCFGKKFKDEVYNEYWSIDTDYHNEIFYKADLDEFFSDEDKLVKWKPSIFMPKKYARLYLVVTGVRIERLQDITYDDIEKEGFLADFRTRGEDIGFDWWKNLWDDINKKRGFGWNKNPFVFVYEFKKIDKSLIEKEI